MAAMCCADPRCSTRRDRLPEGAENDDLQARALTVADFNMEKHKAYFKKMMEAAPWVYKSLDTNRLTLLYFCVSGLDLLGAIDEVDRDRAVAYIYSLQSPLHDHGGFYGYPKVSCKSDDLDGRTNQPHIANTYVALAMLIILGDDFTRVDRDSIAHSLRKWQLPDGSFCCVHGISSLDSESDMRFVYCAACICYILDLWEAVDVEAMYRFIVGARSYDSAFGMAPNTESHGGCTYCALAALSMMGRLEDLPGTERVVDWCAKRQHFGFQGRIEKAMDSCYSFWVGGSLQILGMGFLVNGSSCARFLKSCESSALGGFQKFPEEQAPDVLHSYFSVCGLSLCGLLPPLDALLGISVRARRSAGGALRAARPAGGGRRPPPAAAPPEARAAGGGAAAVPEQASRGPAQPLWLGLALLVCALAVALACAPGARPS